MIPWNCNFQFLPLVPLIPKLCGKEQLWYVTPASGPQQKFAVKITGHIQERKAYILSPIGDLGRGLSLFQTHSRSTNLCHFLRRAEGWNGIQCLTWEVLCVDK